jgi:hypothetical protein
MPRTSKTLLLLLVWLFLFGLVAGSGKAAQGRGGDRMSPQIMPAQEDEEKVEPGIRGALDLRLTSESGQTYPPGEMVISNPFGDTVGYDPRSGQTYQDIPMAYYRTYPMPGGFDQQEVVLNIPNAMSGVYSLRVIGTARGRYSLKIKGYDASGSHADVSFRFLIEPGQIDHYLIDYSNRGGASLNARRTRVTE